METVKEVISLHLEKPVEQIEEDGDCPHDLKQIESIKHFDPMCTEDGSFCYDCLNQNIKTDLRVLLNNFDDFDSDDEMAKITKNAYLKEAARRAIKAEEELIAIMRAVNEYIAAPLQESFYKRAGEHLINIKKENKGSD